MEEDVIPVRYIGRKPIKEGHAPMQRNRDDYHRTVEGPGDFYEMDLNIDGKEVTAVLIVNEEISVKIDRNWGKRNPMIGLYTFTYPTENEEWYEEFKSSLEPESEVGKAGEELTLDMRKSTINMDIPHDVEEYRKMDKKIIGRLYEIKKSTLTNVRKKSFDEKLKKYEEIRSEIKLDNIMANLSEEEAKKAKELHDKMVECVLVAKYGLSDYISFMRNLPEIVRKERAYIAHSTINALHKNKKNVYPPLSYSPYYVAGVIEERDEASKKVCDVYDEIYDSSDELLFVDIAPIKKTYKEKIEESGIKVLGTLSDDPYHYRSGSKGEKFGDDQGARIHMEIFDGDNCEKPRKFILIYEDTDGNLRFRKEWKNDKRELSIEIVGDRVENVSIEDKEIVSKQLDELTQSQEVNK